MRQINQPNLNPNLNRDPIPDPMPDPDPDPDPDPRARYNILVRRGGKNHTLIQRRYNELSALNDQLADAAEVSALSNQP